MEKRNYCEAAKEKNLIQSFGDMIKTNVGEEMGD